MKEKELERTHGIAHPPPPMRIGSNHLLSLFGRQHRFGGVERFQAFHTHGGLGALRIPEGRFDVGWDVFVLGQRLDVQLGDHEFGFTGEPRFFVFN